MAIDGSRDAKAPGPSFKGGPKIKSYRIISGMDRKCGLNYGILISAVSYSSGSSITICDLWLLNDEMNAVI